MSGTHLELQDVSHVRTESHAFDEGGDRVRTK